MDVIGELPKPKIISSHGAPFYSQGALAVSERKLSTTAEAAAVLTMPSQNTILVAEDEPKFRNFLRLALRADGYNVEFVHTGEEVLNYLKGPANCASLLLLDILLPRTDVLETLEQVRKLQPDLSVVMLSDLTSPGTIVEVMRRGAADFLPKPSTHEQLRAALNRVLGLRAPLPVVDGCHAAAIHSAETMASTESWSERLDHFLDKIAGSDVPVLVQGETGVGKEMLARKIHARSLRAHKPFLKINCAALPAELVESELFGYDRGAFTGAIKNNPGKFEVADGGTILLDEIGDMDVRLQAKLLQVLQDKEFIRLGSKESTRVDVRVIASTHCNLEQLIVEGLFREDLYYRLNVVNIVIPPLRERTQEILPLAEYFLVKHATAGENPPEFQPVLRHALIAHDWPGNVRELENVLRRFLVYRSSALIAEELREKTRHRMPQAHAVELPKVTEILSGSAPKPPVVAQMSPSVSTASILGQVDEQRKRAEADAILAALDEALWNRKEAAAILDIDYKALLYKMKKLGIGEKRPARHAGEPTELKCAAGKGLE